MKFRLLAILLCLAASASAQVPSYPPGVTGPPSSTIGDCATYANTSGNKLGDTPCPTGATGANPTATAGPTAVNGSATTFMRSDAAPACCTSVNTTSLTAPYQYQGSVIATFPIDLSSNYSTFFGYQAGVGNNTTTITKNLSACFGFQVCGSNGAGMSGTQPEATAFGGLALSLLTTGNNNNAFGTGAMRHETTGGGNVAVGTDAMGLSVGMINNVAVGNNALGSGGDNSNVAVGNSAMQGQASSAAANNVVIGYAAMQAPGLTTATSNVVVGHNAFGVPTSTSFSVAVGESSLKLATGNSNTAVGSGSGQTVTSGQANVLVGLSSGGTTLVTGSNVVLVGETTDTATSSTSNAVGIGGLTKPGSQDVAVGYQALTATTGDSQDNTAIGYGAGIAITSGATDALVGFQAGGILTTGINDVAIGSGANFVANNTGSSVAIGSAAIAGGASVSIGRLAGASNSAATPAQVLIGSTAGRFISSGGNNTGIGFATLTGISGTPTTGSNNTAIGYQAGNAVQGAANGNTLIGANAGLALTSGTNVTAVGLSVGSGSTTCLTATNVLLLGTSSATDCASTNEGNVIHIGAGGADIIKATGTGTPSTSVTTIAGSLTAPALATSGTVAGSVCQTSAGITLYEAGVNCYAPTGAVSAAALSFTGSAPVVSACGTSPSIDSKATNNSGTVTVGTVAAASCTVTFANSGFATWNHCRVTSQTTLAAFGYSYTKTVLTVTGTSLVGDLFDYECDGS